MSTQSPQTSNDPQYDLTKVGRIQRILIKGALRDENQEKKLTSKTVFKEVINPLRLPKVNVFNAPDVRKMWRLFCLSALRVLYPPVHEPRSFEQVASQNNIDDKAIAKIEKVLKRSAWVAGTFFFASLLVALWINVIPTWLTALGTMSLTSALYWKYSFLLWQTRLRSLEPGKAGIKEFMATSWWLESLR